MSGDGIRPAREDEAGAVGALIGRAFDHLPQNRALVPDPAARLRVMTGFFTLMTELAAPPAGRVEVIGGPDGTPVAAAVWFDRTLPGVPPDAYGDRLAAVAGRWVPHFAALETLLEEHHPDVPHWHLAFLAVHPHHQRAGLGSALLQHRHARISAPAYLEATNAFNAQLYRRHHYRRLAPYEIQLPDGTPFYRLWRPHLTPSAVARRPSPAP
ncbi:GNAT family N-acetyltransferase [Symbioplanes lichenis]|uniref:GNAT family N-acetyltransferase n=1 Tax=Symbioplanes lichenis TaxID=1629072 RepID=UPI0027398D9C|nr:GNAT family N-acetyltransferase [Actinoplanes lichenis]